MAKPSRTPATVAWMPEACTSAQVASAEGQQDQPGGQGVDAEEPPVLLRQEGVEAQREQRQQQRRRLEVAGVEDGDDADGQQVIHHGEGEQEDPQGAGQVRADDGQDRDGEGDVGGGGDRPAAQRLRGCRG